MICKNMKIVLMREVRLCDCEFVKKELCDTATTAVNYTTYSSCFSMIQWDELIIIPSTTNIFFDLFNDLCCMACPCSNQFQFHSAYGL